MTEDRRPLEIPPGPITGAGRWRRDELAPEDWQYRLDAAACAELRRLVEDVKRRGLGPPDFGADDFPLDALGGDVEAMLDQIENGHGFLVVKGVDLDRYSKSDAEILFWGLCQHLGTAVPQNAFGHVLGHVRDLGYDIDKPNVRNYQTAEELKFHNDSCDVLALMCLRQARSGGESSIASIPSVHNAIMATRPDLLDALYTPMAVDRRGEQGWPTEDDLPYYVMPVFTWHENLMSARYSVRAYYHTCQHFEGVPELSERMVEALDLLDTTARDPENHVEFVLEPGDIQLINNYCVFHARRPFEDHAEEDRKRHLLRAWLSVPNSRPLHPAFAQRFRSTEPGAIRGGIYPSRAERPDAKERVRA